MPTHVYSPQGRLRRPVARVLLGWFPLKMFAVPVAMSSGTPMSPSHGDGRPGGVGSGSGRSSAAPCRGSVSPRGLCLLVRRNLLDVRNR
jgi:hypothetical protein